MRAFMRAHVIGRPTSPGLDQEAEPREVEPAGQKSRMYGPQGMWTNFDYWSDAMPDRLAVEYLDPNDLARNPLNWRTHPKRQQEDLARSLGEFGWVMPLLMNASTGLLIDGHARLDLALARQESSVPVIRLSLTDAQERRLLASLDRIGELAGRNDVMLLALLDEWRDENAPGPLPPGWTDAEVDAIVRDLETARKGEVVRMDGAGGDDWAGAFAERTKPGEVWQLGEHRLAVGDCRDRALLQRLLRGETCRLALVDPPYGNAPQTTHGPRGGYGRAALGIQTIVGDEDTQLLCALPGLLPCVLAEDAVAVVFCQWRTFSRLEAAFLQDTAWERRTVIVWDKGRPGLSGGQQLAEAHEWMVCFKRGSPSEPGGFGGNVWSVGAVSRLDGKRLPHPHMKPIALLEKTLKQFTNGGERVLDLCAGSGSTLIACERSGRVCFACELSPGYADIALSRFEAESGKEPVLLEDA